jgi:hypothetical protein
MPNTPVPAAATGLPKFDRAKVEKAIESLILLLDLTDPDPDLEESDVCEDVDDDTAVDDRGCDEECYACPFHIGRRPNWRLIQ